MKRVHLIISGDVQGVGYRAWTRRHARELALAGWVKNRKDKTVELVAEGPREQLEELITRCGHGPELAVVKAIETHWLDSTGEFVIFEVLY